MKYLKSYYTDSQTQKSNCFQPWSLEQNDLQVHDVGAGGTGFQMVFPVVAATGSSASGKARPLA